MARGMSTIAEVGAPYPNTDLLRFQGWAIISSSGPYCTVWKGSQEVLLIWREGNWQTVSVVA
jgi:hypothetical protein